jgi:release factor glutamine methyltransferase
MGVELLAAPGAVIPRKETEVLGNIALAKLRELTKERGTTKVIDLCTGSGNLPLALAFHEGACVAFGSDLSDEALVVAENNARFLGLSERVRFAQGDMFAPFESAEFLENVDLVTCNPPYISSAKVDTLPLEIASFEPRYAFDGGPFGVRILTSLIRESRRFLKPESWLCFEVGLGQGKAMMQMCSREYRSVEAVTDGQGQIRAVAVQM